VAGGGGNEGGKEVLKEKGEFYISLAE